MFKKSIIFSLALIASSSIYNSSHAFYFMATDDADMHQKFYTQNDSPTLDKVVDSTILVKDKVYDFSQNKYVKEFATESISVAKGIVIGMIIQKAISKLLSKDASTETKNCMIDIAKKLGIKNPENINVRVPHWLIEELFIGIAATDMNGDILISDELNKDPLNNETKFILGHELTHMKEKHCLKSALIKGIVTITTNIIASVMVDKEIKDATEKQQLSSKKSQIKLRLIGLINKLTTTLITHIISRQNEIQADLGSSSLGKDITEGGIKFFEKHEKLRQQLEGTSILSRLITLYNTLTMQDCHPSNSSRTKYLKEYNEKNYNQEGLVLNK